MLENEEPIQKDRLHERVYERLCGLLRQGEFTPGEAVTVARISKAFGVSAMPVREALTRLEAIGVLATVSGRSVGVPKLDLDELNDLRNVRLEVEAVAVGWAVRNRSIAFVADLERILKIMVAAEKAEDVRSFIKANFEFHFRLYQQAASPALLDIINTLWLRVSPHLYHTHTDRADRYRISNEHHESIVEAVRKGDAGAAQRALTEDLTAAYDDLIEALFEAEPSG